VTPDPRGGYRADQPAGQRDRLLQAVKDEAFSSLGLQVSAVPFGFFLGLKFRLMSKNFQGCMVMCQLGRADFLVALYA
jgi:hypothetical protein